MLLVSLGLVNLAALDQLDHPPRVEIHAETDAAAMLGEVLDGEPQPPWTARPHHDPIGTLGKRAVGQLFAESFVVNAEVVDVDARLRHTRAAARLKRVDW